MNRRGFYSIASILIWFFLIMVAIGIVYAQNHVDFATSPPNLTSLTWVDKSPATNESPIHPVIIITYDFINFMGRSAFMIAKEAILFGYNHPEWNAQALMWLVMFAIAAPIIYPVFIIIVSIVLMIVEWRKNRRETLERRNST
jgi:hypothetical protein